MKAQFIKKTSGEVEAALQETAAKVTVDDLRKDFGMISSFETVSTNTENGNHNMGLALSRVNGTVLNPGDTFSYENIVGVPQTLPRAFCRRAVFPAARWCRCTAAAFVRLLQRSTALRCVRA